MTTSKAIQSASTGVDGPDGSVGNPPTDTSAIPELLGFASHELMSPLSTILASTKLLELSPAASHPELIETITSEAHRMTSIVENLLTYARLELGHGRDSEPVLLGRTVESTVARIRADHPEAEIHVTAEAGLTVEVDPADIELVVGNYLSNARKYGRGQPIEVGVRRDDRSAVVCVLDRGPGISDEERDRVFEPFYRAGATAKLEPGLGIGLALCRRVIEGYGGQVWTERRPAGGSIFGFSLSLAEHDPV